MKYNRLEIEGADHLVFGTDPYPVTTSRGLVLEFERPPRQRSTKLLDP